MWKFPVRNSGKFRIRNYRTFWNTIPLTEGMCLGLLGKIILMSYRSLLIIIAYTKKDVWLKIDVNVNDM